ncbi:MAG: 3'-5' exonuclease [Planctomycetota bacterium]
MAEMIPDRMPSGASKGEKRLFDILQDLPEDCVVYYEPIIADRYPDFIVILPEFGLLVIEVKGWYPNQIVQADNENIVLESRGQDSSQMHPLRQARNYMYRLMDTCRENPDFQLLLNKNGAYRGRFAFPFGYFAILSNITSEQLRTRGLTTVFPPARVATRDVVERWMDLDQEDLIQTLKAFFNPFWEFPKMSPEQINVLRAIIHPEIRLKAPRAPGPQASGDISPRAHIHVLDLQQERHARALGSGHRILYGVAGSGKTVLLIARARLLSEQEAENRVLVLCYNVALASYLKQCLADCAHATVCHFDQWAINNGVTRRRGEENDSLGARMLDRLTRDARDVHRFDAVLIDEAQDFAPAWFECALKALKEQLDGDLVIVSDASQGLYRRIGVSWESLGIQARGRTISTRFDLHRNYRNSHEILTLARHFAASPTTDTEDGMLCVPVDPELAVRKTGIKPVAVRASSRQEECDRIVSVIADLRQGRFFGHTLPEPVAEERIGILYPRMHPRYREHFDQLYDRLRRQHTVCWLNRDREARTRVNAPGIKIQTIHSAKGLQYQAVILMWAELLFPPNLPDDDEETYRRLLYVALTRAEDYLAITSCGQEFPPRDTYPSAVSTIDTRS